MTEGLTRHVRKFVRAKTGGDPRATLYNIEAEAMKALANPKRLLVLDLLSDGRERNVTELVVETRLSQSNLSQNLAVMRMAGLLATRRDGTLVYYRVADPRVVKAVTLMRAVMEEQAEGRRELQERAARTRHRVKVGALSVLSIAAAVGFFALAHPLLVGGGFSDLAGHLQYMAASGDFSSLLATCFSVAPDMPMGASSEVMG